MKTGLRLATALSTVLACAVPSTGCEKQETDKLRAENTRLRKETVSIHKQLLECWGLHTKKKGGKSKPIGDPRTLEDHSKKIKKALKEKESSDDKSPIDDWGKPDSGVSAKPSTGDATKVAPAAKRRSTTHRAMAPDGAGKALLQGDNVEKDAGLDDSDPNKGLPSKKEIMKNQHQLIDDLMK